MKKVLLAAILGFVFAASAHAGPVEIGMSEAKLLEAKGKPEWNATAGKCTTYSWPDMEVSLTDGKVDHVRTRGPKAEKKNPTEELKATGPAEDFMVEVVEVVAGGGVVVDLLQEHSAEGKTSHLASIGGGGPSAAGSTGYVISGKHVYLKGLRDSVDGDRFKISAAPAGTQTLDRSTMRRFIVKEAKKL